MAKTMTKKDIIETITKLENAVNGKLTTVINSYGIEDRISLDILTQWQVLYAIECMINGDNKIMKDIITNIYKIADLAEDHA